MKRLLVLVLCLCLCLGLSGCGSKEVENGKIKVAASIFPLYDFARQVVGERAEVTLLIDPATEVHSFEPTPTDIKTVYSADAFLYIGGESDTWAQRLIKDTKADVLALKSYVELISAEDDHEHKHSEYDEHIWTAPSNAIKMVDSICALLCELDPENAQYYRQNADRYNAQISDVKTQIEQVVEQSEGKFLLVADRFPFAYFVREFGLSYKAAFGGCANSSDISLKGMSELTDAVHEHNLKSAFYVELSNKSIANALSESTGVKLYELHSAHNVSADDFKSGITYVDIMKNNAEALRKGL